MIMVYRLGGNAKKKDCKAHIHKNGQLNEGEVFIGTPGRLNCLKLAHVVGPVWNGGDFDEGRLLADTIINIFKAMTAEKNSVLRSVALPLISTGSSGFPKKLAAEVIKTLIFVSVKLHAVLVLK